MFGHCGESKESTDAFSAVLKRKLRKAGVDADGSAGIVDLPAGHLAIVLALKYPDSSPELLAERLRAERIARYECAKYIHERNGKRNGSVLGTGVLGWVSHRREILLDVVKQLPERLPKN